MTKQSRFYVIIGTVLAVMCLIYWLIPIPGKLAYIPDNLPEANTWPQIAIVPVNESQFEVVVQDENPWSFVRLELTGATSEILAHGEQNGSSLWEWSWLVNGVPSSSEINLYHSCDNGCQKWAVAQLPVAVEEVKPEDLVPTKLGLVFANPERDWHGRQGWDIEITYAQLAEEEFWGIDDLAQRVQIAESKGLRVLVRIEYGQGQNIPPPDDFVALDEYLRYVQRIARDERLKNVYGFIIGSNFNTLGANNQSPENPVTPEWYARVFNGYGADPTLHNNALEIIRRENQQVRILVGPINPWNSDQTGSISYEINVPWLNYFNSVASYINQSVDSKIRHGISDIAPDGFAVQAFGRVTAPSLSTDQKPQEPFIDLYRDEWGEAQAGFRVYLDWLAIINQHEHTIGKPVYINASNTFDGEVGSFPAENYPSGWLTSALMTINEEPQIQMLGWFMDGFAHDEQWAMFSLTNPRGLLEEASKEFEDLLKDK